MVGRHAGAGAAMQEDHRHTVGLPHSSIYSSCRSLTARRCVRYGSISGYSSRT